MSELGHVPCAQVYQYKVGMLMTMELTRKLPLWCAMWADRPEHPGRQATTCILPTNWTVVQTDDCAYMNRQADWLDGWVCNRKAVPAWRALPAGFWRRSRVALPFGDVLGQSHGQQLGEGWKMPHGLTVYHGPKFKEGRRFSLRTFCWSPWGFVPFPDRMDRVGIWGRLRICKQPDGVLGPLVQALTPYLRLVFGRHALQINILSSDIFIKAH